MQYAPWLLNHPIAFKENCDYLFIEWYQRKIKKENCTSTCRKLMQTFSFCLYPQDKNIQFTADYLKLIFQEWKELMLNR